MVEMQNTGACVLRSSFKRHEKALARQKVERKEEGLA